VHSIEEDKYYISQPWFSSSFALSRIWNIGA